MACAVRYEGGVRALWLAGVIVASGCGVPPPVQSVFPTLEPSSPPVRRRHTSTTSDDLTGDVARGRFFAAPAAYNSRVVALRTSLGRAAISLELAGRRTVIQTASCDRDPQECVRCELAGESDALDGAVCAHTPS